MARKKKAEQPADAITESAASTVHQAVERDELRDNVRVAFESAREAYERLADLKLPRKALRKDTKLATDLQTAADALRDAGAALKSNSRKAARKQIEAAKKAASAEAEKAASAKPKKARKRGKRRFLLVTLVGAGLAVALSSELRSKILDALFGSEEEFEYTSTTAPAVPAPEPAATTA